MYSGIKEKVWCQTVVAPECIKWPSLVGIHMAVVGRFSTSTESSPKRHHRWHHSPWIVWHSITDGGRWSPHWHHNGVGSVDPAWPWWLYLLLAEGVATCLYGEMDLMEFKARPVNMSCHNLLRYNVIPKGTTSLLGLGLNYCIKSPQTDQTTKSTFDRLCQDVRRKYAFSKNPPEDGGYIPKLYIKSDYEFASASKEIEKPYMDSKQQSNQNKNNACRGESLTKISLLESGT